MDNILRSNRIRTAKDGQALVPVIFVMLILTSLAVTFATLAHRQIRASANFNTQTSRYYIELGAINYAMSSLDQTSNHGATYGIVQPSTDTDANGWMPIGDAWVKIDAVDTASMIDLNTVTQATLNQIPILQQNTDLTAAMIDWRTTSTTPSTNGAKSEYYNTLTPPYDSNNGPYDSVEQLLLVDNMTPQILYGTPSGSVVDPSVLATSTNLQPGSGSGSAGGSGSAQSAVSASGRNGTTRQATSSKPGGLGSATTSTPSGATGATGATGAGGTTATAGDTDWTDIYNESVIPLSEMFTTTVWERNVASDGSPRVNINKAAVTDLTAIGLSSSLATALVNYRTGSLAAGGTTSTGTVKPGGTTTSPSTTTTIPGTTTTPKIQSLSRQAKPVTSTPSGGPAGAVGGATGATGATGAAGTAFTSLGDLLNVAGFTQTVLQQVADQLSIDANAYHADMVNINTASQEVLAAIPGMDHTTLQAIVAYRQNRTAFQSMNDFFSLQGLTRQEFQNVVGKICTKSSFYRIRVRVRMPGQDTLYAVAALVQLTENGPQILQWKEVQRSPGWAYWVPTAPLPTPTPPTLINTASSSSTSP